MEDSRQLVRFGATLAMLLLASALLVPLRAQDARDAKDANSAPAFDRTSLNGNVELPRLVDLCAERLHLNIEYDAQVLVGQVTLRLGESLSDDELWALTNHVLASRGFTTIRSRSGGTISVVKTATAPTVSGLESGTATGAQPGFLSVATRVHNLPPKEAVDALKLVANGQNAVVALGTTGLILITDLRPRVEQALDLLAQIDVPLKDTVLEVVHAENVGATSLATSANEVLQAREAIAGHAARGKVVALPDGSGVVLVAPPDEARLWKDLLASLDRRDQPQTKTYAPRHFPVAEVASLVTEVLTDPKDPTSITRLRVIPDELTGTVIVTGTAQQQEKVQELVARLDAVPAEDRRQVRSYPIRNRPVSDVLNLVQTLISGEIDIDVGSGGGLDAGVASPQQSLREFAPGAPLSGVPTTNTQPVGAQDTATAAPTTTEPMRTSARGANNTAGTAKNGKPAKPGDTGAAGGGQFAPPLTLAADLSTNTLLAVGEPRLLSQLDRLVLRLDVRQPQVLLEVMVVSLTDSQTNDLGIELQKFEQHGSTSTTVASLFGLGQDTSGIPFPTPTGTGFTGIVLSPADFSIVVKALETVNHGNSLTRPKVLVNNNETATFNSVLQQPFVSTNASTTVATTSFGGTQDAGTTISVTPNIAEGDQLNLDYEVSLSAFVGDSPSPNIPPPRQQNNLRSVVTIPDAHTVVLGGLESTSDTDAKSQVPWYGELPLIGWMFGTDSTSNNHSRFFVFIRADVLRNRNLEDLKRVSDRDPLRKKLPGDAPEVEPRVIR